MIAIFLFYNFSSGKQSFLSFSEEFKHCNIITYDGEYCIVYELDCYGVHSRIIEIADIPSLTRNIKVIKELSVMITVDVHYRTTFKWKPFWVRSCNEFNRYIAAVDIGFTFNPRHLYSKLLKYHGIRNYEILQHWRRKDGSIQGTERK